jgi:hypothetical protein
MLRRLMSWCVPDSALELRIDEHDVADVGKALAPYEHEAAEAAAESPFGLRIVRNS